MLSLPTARRAILALLPLIAIAATPALAHHPMGGEPLDTFQLGILSGLGHPVLGLDHLAALVGVGLLAWRFGTAALFLPLAWIVGMGLGTLLHLQAIDLPLVEVAVAISIVAIGVLGAVGTKLPAAAIAGLFGLAGLFHGHALAESIIGAEPAPLAGYLIGLVVVQGAIITGVMFATTRLLDSGKAKVSHVRIAAGLLAAVGVAFAALAMTGGGAA